MAEENTVPPGPDEQPVAETATPGQTEAGTDWEARFKGQQRAYNELKAQFDTLKAERDSLAKQLSEAQEKLKAIEEKAAKAKGEASELSASKSALEEKIAKLEEQLGQLKAEREKTDAQLERMRLVINEYPDLAPYEAKGLLRSDLADDKLKEYLDEFRSLVVAQAQQAATSFASGATPPPAGSDLSTLTETDIVNRMMELDSNSEDYRRLEQILINLTPS